MRVCVLEGIVDHTNVGAIFRSAAALNVDGILVSPTCCDPLYRRSARVSMARFSRCPGRVLAVRRAYGRMMGWRRCTMPAFRGRHGVDG